LKISNILRFFVLFLFLFLSSCKYLPFNKENKEQQGKGKIVAKVKDSYLYESDLSGISTSHVTKQDSILIRQGFINNWVKDQVLYYKALANLTDQEKNKDQELENYYRSLIKYEYEKKIIDQKLDKEVPDSEVVKYYKEHMDIFKVSRCLVRVVFISLPLKAPDIKKVKKWFSSSLEKDQDLLSQYCMGNALKYSLDQQKWYYFDDVTLIIPIKQFDCNNLRTNVDFELTDSTHLYMFNFKEIKHEGTLSPLEFEKEKIKNIIIHRRSIDLIKKIEENIYKEAGQKNYFTIYE
jgi:hypothetical protein